MLIFLFHQRIYLALLDSNAAMHSVDITYIVFCFALNLVLKTREQKKTAVVPMCITLLISYLHYCILYLFLVLTYVSQKGIFSI